MRKEKDRMRERRKEIEENGKKMEQQRCTIQPENQLCSTSIDKHPGINLPFPNARRSCEQSYQCVCVCECLCAAWGE